ncbi:hypothetical protein [Candidatus Palauibacter sp.]|uniref:hypothetical protein n=1 Tax=Candidatus Palauibacter sp. TaxID=3101350 RepID=UPI003B01F43E
MTMLNTPDMTFVPSSVQKSSEDDGWCVKLVASPEGEGTTSMLSLDGLTKEQAGQFLPARNYRVWVEPASEQRF